MKTTKYIIGAFIFFNAISAISYAEEPLKAEIVVAQSAPGIAYSRDIFGGFLEHFHRQIYGGLFEPGSPLSDEQGFRKDVIEAVRELHVPVVRWPGGCFASAYHWKDGVGKERRPAYDKAWGVEDPNNFGTDEFIAWCRLAGVEPYICGNAGTGTPEEMSDWVEYCNQTKGYWAKLRAENGHPQPYAVHYWSIGNENYGGWEIGAKTAEEWGPLVCETAKMIRAEDPSTILLAASLPDENWMRNLLKRAGGRLNMLSVHGYWDELWAVNNPSSYQKCMMRSGEPENTIIAAEKLIEAEGFKGRIGLAFDEWNLRSWHHPGLGMGFDDEKIKARDLSDLNQTYTMADAVFSAGFLNACLRHADTVKMANISPLVNTRGPIFTHPQGVVKRTTYHVLSMYANLLNPVVVNSTITSDPFTFENRSTPAVDAAVTRDESGAAWRIALLNRHPSTAAKCALKIGDKTFIGPHAATILSGDSVDAYNDIDKPDRVIPQKTELTFENGAVTIPPHSVVIIELN